MSLAPACLSLLPIALLAWALRHHFRNDDGIPRGLRLLSVVTLAGYALFVFRSLRAPDPVPPARLLLEACCFLASVLLFVWAVRTTRHRGLRLIHSAGGADELYLDGPYRFIRHPIYAAYVLFWIGTAIGAGPLQWLVAAGLVAWYRTAARAEERRFAAGPLAPDYDRYRRRAGMFVPRLRALLDGPAPWRRSPPVPAIAAGTPARRRAERHQARALFDLALVFAAAGSAACLAFAGAFGSRHHPLVLASAAVTLGLNAGLVIQARRWRRSRADHVFLRRAVWLFTSVGLSWGVFINALVAVAPHANDGPVLALALGVVAASMIMVPIRIAFGFFVPTGLAAAVVAWSGAPDIRLEAMLSFAGFAVFVLCGIVSINRMFRALSDARAALHREHETVSVLLREYRRGSSDWIWETDDALTLLTLSGRTFDRWPSLRRMLLGRPLPDIIGEQHDDRLAQALAGRHAFRDLPVRFLGSTRLHWINLTGHPVHDYTGRFTGFRGIGTDITDRHETRARVEFLASHDDLTRLPNRATFVQAVARTCARDRSVALILIDLDDFRAVNDVHGHRAGDRALEVVGRRIAAAIRDNDVAGRLGGDEFAILLPACDLAQARVVAERILAVCAEKMSIGDALVRLAASAGIAAAVETGDAVEHLFTHADLALDLAKERGKGIAVVFEAWMAAGHHARHQREHEIAEALASERLHLEFQPIIDLETGFVVAAEALVRWMHPTLGLLTAAAFVPQIETGHLMEALGAHVLDVACKTAAAWRDPIGVNVNLSPVQLRSGRFLDILRDSLRRSGLAPARLCLEITETSLLDGGEATRAQLRQIRAMGVSVMLDDFGTGYSSIKYLQELVVDGIKIDADFTRRVADADEGAARVAAIVRAMARLASDLDMLIVAEGVETRKQAAWLRDNGITLAQGYLLGRPSREEPRQAGAAPYDETTRTDLPTHVAPSPS